MVVARGIWTIYKGYARDVTLLRRRDSEPTQKRQGRGVFKTFCYLPENRLPPATQTHAKLNPPPMVTILKISKILPNEKNPRFIKDHKFEQLVKSIKEFPEMLKIRPIVVDSNFVILGGNMRLRACIEAGLKEVPVIMADQLTEEQKRRFIITDNVGFGEWDWQALANEWDAEELADWGLDTPGFELSDEDLGTDFSLPDGDKAPFQQMTFTLADEQAEQIKNAIADIKQTEEYKYAETMGNENSNGNALYLIVSQWAEQRK